MTPISETVTEEAALFTNNLLTDANAADLDGDTVEISGTPAISATGDSDDPGGVTVSGSTVSIDPNYYDGLKAGDQVVVTVNYNVTDGTEIVANTATYTIDGANEVAVGQIFTINGNVNNKQITTVEIEVGGNAVRTSDSNDEITFQIGKGLKGSSALNTADGDDKVFNLSFVETKSTIDMGCRQ